MLLTGGSYSSNYSFLNISAGLFDLMEAIFKQFNIFSLFEIEKVKANGKKRAIIVARNIFFVNLLYFTEPMNILPPDGF